MKKSEKVKIINHLFNQLPLLFRNIDKAFNSSLDLLSVNFIEKNYLQTTSEELQDLHNQWAEDGSELKNLAKKISKELKHIEILPEDDFFINNIRENLMWNVSLCWELITENLTKVFTDLIHRGQKKDWEINFVETEPKEILERILAINDNELETFLIKTFAEGHTKHSKFNNSINLVVDWWIAINGKDYYLSNQNDIKGKINLEGLLKKLKTLKNKEKDYVQIELYPFQTIIKLAILSDFIRLISVEIYDGYDQNTIDIAVNLVKANDDIVDLLTSEVWEEYITIITNNLEKHHVDNLNSKIKSNKIPTNNYAEIARKNSFFNEFLNRLSLLN